MTILGNAKRVQRAVLHDAALGGRLAEDLKEVAVKAVTGGIDSEDWKRYMAIFADNEAQLQRLIGRDATVSDKIWFDESVAYLASNGVCTSPSTARFIDDIDPLIDSNLDPTPGTLSAPRALDIPDPHPEIMIPERP
ncbi:MAG: hypothetical protein WCF57_12135 [Pyrinomonadaceae bacterium]